MQRMMECGGDRAVNYKKYDKLLKDLERDSVDTDILDEELKRLQETEPRTCRGRTARLIESSPLHVTICILILIDVAIVTTEILMDMHSTRSQYLEATRDILETTDYLRETHPDVLGNYGGESIGHMLEAVRSKSTRQRSPAGNSTQLKQQQFRNSMSQLIDWLRAADIDAFLSNISRKENATSASRFCTPNCSACMKNTLLEAIATNSLQPSLAETEKDAILSQLSPRNTDNATLKRLDCGSACSTENRHVKPGVSTKTIQQASHIMHYIGIGIVGLFALQVFVKMYALGLDFFRQKMEVFDGIITLTSFGVDVVTLEGVSATQSEETIAVLVVFLLWRVLRLANALLVAAKQRQEFRIKLQKRGRQRSDKKIEWLESDLNWKKREIDLLARLCIEKGATEEEINTCRPKNNFPKLNASAGLSSVASFSLGLSMSMRGATDDPTNQAGMRRITNITNSRKQSFQDLFPVRPAASSHHHTHRTDQSPITSTSAPVASSSSVAATAASSASSSSSSSLKKPGRLGWLPGTQKTPPPEAHQLLVSSVSASPMEEISEEERSASVRGEDTNLECITIDFGTYEETDENEARPQQNEAPSSHNEAYPFQQETIRTPRIEACVCLAVVPLPQDEAHPSYNGASSSLLSIPSILLPDVEPDRPNRPSSVAVISGLYGSAGLTDDGCYRNSVCSPVSPDADGRCLSSRVRCLPHPFHSDAAPNSARQYWSRLRRHVIK